VAGVLVVFASTHGQTAKIAERIAQAAEADVYRAADAPSPDDYDGVIVGGSLHAGKHQPELVEWVKANLSALSGLPTAFFSVSLTAAEDTAEARDVTQRCIDEFLAETGWKPGRVERIAGALQYREYDVFTRTLMRLMMKRGGHPTDASHDYDYTDWDAVERLGREFAAEMAKGNGPPRRATEIKKRPAEAGRFREERCSYVWSFDRLGKSGFRLAPCSG
jgi:menaquinone-dependent protoporphyrinogen oxidase